MIINKYNNITVTIPEKLFTLLCQSHTVCMYTVFLSIKFI